MSAVEAAQECWGSQSCLGQKQGFFDVFWFCMSIGALFFWGRTGSIEEKEYQKTIANRSQ